MGEAAVPACNPAGGGAGDLLMPRHGQGNHEREKAVSAAVGLVVASARLGVVTLCASVAHIVRDKMRLEQQVVELEKKLEALESKGMNRVSEVTCHSATHGESLPESPSSLRCGSAPPSFLTIPPRKLSGNDNQVVKEVCQNCESGGTQFYCSACQQRQTENHDSSSNTTQLKRSDFTCGFARGYAHASTRSLNLSRVPSASRFMRRKYSTISLRRIHRTGLSSKGSSSGTLSQSSSSSTGSQEWAEDSSRRGSNSSRSCVVTVAEVYSPPSPPPLLTTESAAVKLLAKKLASVMQEENWDNWPSLSCPSSSDPPQGCSTYPDTPITSSPTALAHDDLCAPHPLEGCECVACTRLSSDPASPMYSLTTSEGSLLPRGSMVLVRGDMVGTVIYFGHRRHPLLNKGVQYLSPTSNHNQASSALCNGGTLMDDAGSLADVTSSPLGVTIALWSPDHGEMFVPLKDVVCQLDEEANTERGEGTHSPILAADCCEACPTQFIQASEDYCHPNRKGEFQHSDMINENPQYGDPQHANSLAMINSCQESVPVYPVESHHIDLAMSPGCREKPKSISEKVRTSRDNKPHDEGLVYNSSVVQRLGQTCDLDRDTEDECENDTENYIAQSSYSKMAFTYRNLLNQSENELSELKNAEKIFCVDCYSDKPRFEPRLSDTEPEVSMYDTSDSAISLNFKQPHSHDEICCAETCTFHPTSLAETDVESLNFGDTWDSGCCMKRGRCGSLSSEQYSDLECENTKLKSQWAQSLNDAFDSVWNKYPSDQDSCNSYRYNRLDPDYPYRNSRLNSALSDSSSRPNEDSCSGPTMDSGVSSVELNLQDYSKYHRAPSDWNTPPQLSISNHVMDDSEV